MSIRILVDFNRCDVNGSCAALMPDVFKITDDGTLELVMEDVDDSRSDEVDEVILCCPAEAIARG